MRLSAGPLVLDGDEISLKSVKLDGRNLRRSEYKLAQTRLIIDDLAGRFTLKKGERFELEFRIFA